MEGSVTDSAFGDKLQVSESLEDSPVKGIVVKEEKETLREREVESRSESEEEQTSAVASITDLDDMADAVQSDSEAGSSSDSGFSRYVFCLFALWETLLVLTFSLPIPSYKSLHLFQIQPGCWS